jgi:hypothetical protein
MRSSVQIAANALVGLIISHSALAAPILYGGISRRADNIIAPHPLVLFRPDVGVPAVPAVPDPNTTGTTAPAVDPNTTGTTAPAVDPNTADPTVPVAPDPNTADPIVPVAPDPNTADPSLTADPAIQMISRSGGAPSTAGGISRRFRPFSFEVFTPDPADVPDLSETTFVPGPGGLSRRLRPFSAEVIPPDPADVPDLSEITFVPGPGALSRRFRPFSFEVAAPDPADVPDLSDTTFVPASSVTFDPEFDTPPAPVDSDTASAP